MKRISVVVAARSWRPSVGLAAQQVVKVDPAIPAYQKASGVSGSLSSIGSDSMNNLMTLWAETFRKYYPNVKVQVEGKGSSTAPPALIAGTAQFGPMSRQMRSTEIDQFQQRYGYKPTEIRTSYDALAVYVHRDNPIKQLSLAQVEAIFGKSRRRGFKQNVTTWGQLGLTGDWANRPIGLYGRNSASGTYGFFREHVLRNGDYKDTVKEQPGSASVVQGITEDRYAIGYSGAAIARPACGPCRWPRPSRSVLRGDLRRGDQRQIPAQPLPLPLREQGARASRSIRCRSSSSS